MHEINKIKETLTVIGTEISIVKDANILAGFKNIHLDKVNFSVPDTKPPEIIACENLYLRGCNIPMIQYDVFQV
jgi:hypothetical protein